MDMIKLLFAVFDFAKLVEQELADGFQPGQDIPVIVKDAADKLLPQILAYMGKSK